MLFYEIGILEEISNIGKYTKRREKFHSSSVGYKLWGLTNSYISSGSYAYF